MTNTEIILAYTAGEKTLEEANAALAANGAGYHLNPEKNTINPDEVGRFGLLDTGTGSLDKVEVVDGKVLGFDAGNMVADVLFNGKTYRVQGDTLVE